MGKRLKRVVYLSAKPDAWDRLAARTLISLTILTWVVFILGLGSIDMDPSNPGGYIILFVGLGLAVPVTIFGIKVWSEILRTRKGVILDEEGVTLFGDFVSWFEIREVRWDPKEGHILVFRPDSDATQPLSFLNMDNVPHLRHFLKSLQDRGIEIKTHRR